MIRKKKKAFLIAAGVCMLIAALVFFLENERVKAPAGNHAETAANQGGQSTKITFDDPSAEPVSTAAPEDLVRRSSDAEFMSDANEPHLLWQQEGTRIFALQDRLYYEKEGELAESLYEWTNPNPVQAWIAGEYMLLGAQLKEKEQNVENGNGMLGDWQVVKLGSTPSISATKVKFFGPHEVLSVMIAESPELFFMTTLNGDSYSESVIDPSTGAWHGLRRGEPDQDIPEKKNGVDVLSNNRAVSMQGGLMVHAYSLNGSTIFYQKNERDFLVRFYDGLTLKDMKRVLVTAPDSTGESDGDDSRILGRFRDQAGEERMSLLYSDVSFPFEPRLWADEYQLLNDGRTFVHADSDQLEVIQYGEGFGYEEGSEEAAPRSLSFPLDGAKLLLTDGDYMKFDVGGEVKYISWQDLIYGNLGNAGSEGNEGNAVSAGEEGGWFDWASPLADFNQKREAPENREEARSSHVIPAWPEDEDNTNAKIPDEVREAKNSLYQGSDYGFSETYRLIDSVWYMLIDNHLLSFKDHSIHELGVVPVTITVSVSEGFGGNGARDFLRADDGGWIIADTEGNRVMELNEKLELVAEQAVPTPSKLMLAGERIQVDSLGSVITLDSDLKVVGTEEQAYYSTVKLAKQAYDWFRPQQYFEDGASGLSWYYLFGYVYQYNGETNQLRSFYIGRNENYRGIVRMIPYEDEVLVLLDNRIDLFDRQGKWLSRIEIPRAQPDGIYDRTPYGENSYALDAEAGRLYLLQGYQVLAINLERNSVRTLFQQNYSDMGKLVLRSNHLYFLLHSNEFDRYEYYRGDSLPARKTLYTELVDVDVSDGRRQRHVVEGYYEGLEVKNGDKGNRAFTLVEYKD
ncbi:hypothetical protein [Paenibacillus sp. HB172176]|uniref:hypothetical protein n=1 Tax=Paenibacillus sp. HB172176 TaxID=2493690 RepID=UPI0014388F7F|nr:hypothetical protein [Paenibacillus sp. HB172176]